MDLVPSQKISRPTENDIEAVNPVNKQAYIETLSARLLSTSCFKLEIALRKKPSCREVFVEVGELGDVGLGEEARVSSPGALVVGSRLVDMVGVVDLWDTLAFRMM